MTNQNLLSERKERIRVLKKIIFRLLKGEKINSMERFYLLKYFDEALLLVDQVIEEARKAEEQTVKRLERLAELVRNRQHLKPVTTLTSLKNIDLKNIEIY